MQIYPPFPSCREDTPKRQAEKQIYQALAASDLEGYVLYEVKPLSSAPQLDFAIWIVGIGIFLGDNDIRTTTMADHIDHYVNLLGPEHVGIGLDYAFESDDDEGKGLASVLERDTNYWPKAQYDYPGIDCAGPGQILELAEELFRRQSAEKDVAAIMGGNCMRVAEAVWK